MPQQVKEQESKPAQQPVVKKPEPEKPKEKSEAVKEMEKISTYNGDSTDKYNWSQNI